MEPHVCVSRNDFPHFHQQNVHDVFILSSMSVKTASIFEVPLSQHDIKHANYAPVSGMVHMMSMQPDPERYVRIHNLFCRTASVMGRACH